MQADPLSVQCPECHTEEGKRCFVYFKTSRVIRLAAGGDDVCAWAAFWINTPHKSRIELAKKQKEQKNAD